MVSTLERIGDTLGTSIDSRMKDKEQLSASTMTFISCREYSTTAQGETRPPQETMSFR